jgi:hypothetical protein
MSIRIQGMTNDRPSPRLDRWQVPDEDLHEKHPAEVLNEELDRQRKEALRKLVDCCMELKASNPEAWNNFETRLHQIYGYLQRMDRKTPLDAMGSGVHPDYWTLNKAYLRGALEIVESMFATLPILPPEPPVVSSLPEAPENFFRKCLRFFGNLLGIRTRSN